MNGLRFWLFFVPACWASLAPAADEPRQMEKFRPQWQLGQQWTVQTQSRQQQTALPRQQSVTARWQFDIEAVEPVQGKPCWRIAVRPQQAEQVLPEPKTTIWVDQAAAAIRQIETQLRTPRGYKTVTESYPMGAQAAPVVGPLSVLPIALPQFPESGLKAVGAFEYETVSGPGGIKAVGEVGFTTEVRQELAQPTADGLKGILDDPQIKSLGDDPLVEVKLTTPDQTVRQIWRQDSPWPIYADNGVTQMRLVDERRMALPSRPGAGDGAAIGDGSGEPSYDGTKSLVASDGLEKAAAEVTPWSGYWWPIRDGQLLVPLGKYDRLTGHQAAAWERANNPPGPDVPDWFGYCHAWSAASMLESEPRGNRTAAAGSARVSLDIGDQKGLLTACHTEDLANSWGARFGDGEGSEDPQDLRPDLLWRLLKLHLGQQGVPLVLDVEAKEEVWNYPVYEYQISYRPDDGVGRPAPSAYRGSLTLLMADDGVPPAYRGTKVRKETCEFRFQMRNGNVVMGSGQWIGPSQKDHPDFAWYPYQAVAANPEVQYPKVQQLVAERQATPPAGPPVSPPPKPSTSPTPPSVPPEAQPDHPPKPTRPGAKKPKPSPKPAVAPAGQATQPVVLSPLELAALVVNQTSSFAFDATLDRFDGASYKPGETFFVRVTSDKPGYLYLLQVDSRGNPALLFPTAGEDNRIPGGKLVEIRPTNAAGGFPVAGPAGMLRIKAVVTSRPLAFSGSLELLQSAEPGQQTQSQAAPFRWHPTQRQQIKELLTDQQELTAEQIGCREPQELLGPFAQDMTTVYIDAPSRNQATEP